VRDAVDYAVAVRGGHVNDSDSFHGRMAFSCRRVQWPARHNRDSTPPVTEGTGTRGKKRGRDRERERERERVRVRGRVLDGALVDSRASISRWQRGAPDSLCSTAGTRAWGRAAGACFHVLKGSRSWSRSSVFVELAPSPLRQSPPPSRLSPFPACSFFSSGLASSFFPSSAPPPHPLPNLLLFLFQRAS
jgi:hypothetical protein